MTYQDKWGNGRVIEKGYRECASRYEIVRAFCERAFGRDGAFTVRDIGANLCYFGLRLTEDFPKCKVTAYESHHSVVPAAVAHLIEHGNERIALDTRHVNFMLMCLNCNPPCDLVLALSVLHHMKEPLGVWLGALKIGAWHSIVELAVEPSARNHKRAPAVPEGAKILGFGESHLEAAKRPIFYLEGK